MTNLNDKEMELLKAVIEYELEEVHERIDGYYQDKMYYEITEDLQEYEAMLRLMDEFKSNGPVLEWLDTFPYMGVFKSKMTCGGYVEDKCLDEIVELVAEDNDLEEYAEGVINFLKSPQTIVKPIAELREKRSQSHFKAL